MMIARLGCMLLSVLAFCGQDAWGQEWGSVKGRFVVEGALLQRPPIAAPMGALPDQAVLVDPKGGLQNVAMWLYLEPDEDPPAVHPTYRKKIDKPVTLEVRNWTYTPRIVSVVTGQPVMLVNRQQVGHNYKLEGFSNASVNEVVNGGATFRHTLEHQERYPMSLSSSIYPWMTGRILVRDLPYMAVSGKDGTFTIENLPVGTHTFQVWHEVVGNIKEMKLRGIMNNHGKGLVEIDVVEGMNDLGDIAIEADELN